MMRVWLLLASQLCIIPLIWGAYREPSHVYHDHQDLTDYLQEVAHQFPNITYLYSIGQSVDARELWVLAISATSPDQHVVRRPEVKYVGNMHGNEAVGRELLIHFINHVLIGYGQDSDVTMLLESSRVHVLVSMNPDGFEETVTGFSQQDCSGVRGRYNAAGVDLNRNFPDYFISNNARRQPETRAVMQWLNDHQFVISANLHGGALVANYPYDNNERGRSVYSATPDNDVFRNISRVYSYAHTDMYTGRHCNDIFTDGITNGADWYAIQGGMQDYNYAYAGCMEITLELACCKYPRANTLEGYWNKNRNALVRFLQQGLIGVKGVVSDERGAALGGAAVTIIGREGHGLHTTTDGEYWKLLLPGEYTLQVELVGYDTVSVPMTVPGGAAITMDITLTVPCTDHHLNYANQNAYRIKVTKADDADNLDPYPALDGHPDSPLVVALRRQASAKFKITVGRSSTDIQEVVARRLCVKTTNVKKVTVEYLDANNNSLHKITKKAMRTTCIRDSVPGVHTVRLTFKKYTGASEITLRNLKIEACYTN